MEECGNCGQVEAAFDVDGCEVCNPDAYDEPLCSGCDVHRQEVAGGLVDVHGDDCPEYARGLSELVGLPWAGG